MKLFSRMRLALIIFAVALAVSIAADNGEMGEGTGRNVRLPLEFDDEGNLRSQLFAGSMSAEDGLIKATDVKVEFYGPGGGVQMVMEAGECVFDKPAGRLDSESNVVFRRGDSVITGKGLEWESGKKTVKILSNVRVELSHGFKGFSHFADAEAQEGKSDD